MVSWKMHFELAQMEERLGEFERARAAYAASIHVCPSNLQWKVWLSGARMELRSGDATRIPIARALMSRALNDVPKKMRYMVRLDQSRMHEFVGELSNARAVLRVAQTETPLEWKLFLERVILELRAGHIDSAIAETKAALEVHNGAGRIWAILISLHQKQSPTTDSHSATASSTADSLNKQWSIFRTAIQSVPKSGEVWCEGARLCLNPYAPRYFNLKEARRFLGYAMHFTPQYGDSFIEYLRLEMIIAGMPDAQHGRASATSSAGNKDDPFGCAPVHIRRVQQACVNNDPNYGSAWFTCKREEHGTPVEVLQVASEMIQRHLVAHQRQYVRAILAGWYPKENELTAPSVGADAPTKPDHDNTDMSDGGDEDTMSNDDVACDSSIFSRRAALVESGEMGLLSAASSPTYSSRCSITMSSACAASTSTSTSTAVADTSLSSDDDQPHVIFHSLHTLYPPIVNMCVSERHFAIYGAAPITS